MVEQMKSGCILRRGFMFSPDGQDFDFMMRLMDKGYKELYYTAPYHWGLINPKEKMIKTYTEGDTGTYTCANTKMLLKEAEEHLEFIKKNYPNSPSVWTEGEELIKNLKRRIK